jgi:hypothetical protein
MMATSREKNISSTNISAKLGAKDVQHSSSLPRFSILCVMGGLSTAKGTTYLSNTRTVFEISSNVSETSNGHSATPEAKGTLILHVT